ncbi:MAG: GNAT family N-acetyltransferase [Anaerolineae bacterium]
MDTWTVRTAESFADYARVAEFFGHFEGPQAHAYCQRRLTFTRHRPEFTRYIEADGQVVSALLLRHERWLLDGATLDAGLVENVLTHPDYRRRGLFTALLNDSLALLRAEGYPLAAIHGDAALHARFGFSPVRYQVEVTLPAERAVALPATGRARPFAPADLGDLAALYDATYAALAAVQERTAGVWQWLLPDLGDVVVMEGAAGPIAGYARVEQRAVLHKLRVTEAAAADGRAAQALLAILGNRARREGLETLYLPLSFEHPLARTALLAGGQVHLAGPSMPGSHWGHADQARVLDLRAALQALAPTLNRRLATSRYAGWTGTLALDTESGGATLELTAGGVRTSPERDAAPAVAVYLPSALLAPLLLGTYSAQELAAQPGVRVTAPVLALLGALFPARWPCTENEDWWIETT